MRPPDAEYGEDERCLARPRPRRRGAWALRPAHPLDEPDPRAPDGWRPGRLGFEQKRPGCASTASSRRSSAAAGGTPMTTCAAAVAELASSTAPSATASRRPASCRRRTRSARWRAACSDRLPPYVHAYFHDYDLLDPLRRRRSVWRWGAVAPPAARRPAFARHAERATEADGTATALRHTIVISRGDQAHCWQRSGGELFRRRRPASAAAGSPLTSDRPGCCRPPLSSGCRPPLAEHHGARRSSTCPRWRRRCISPSCCASSTTASGRSSGALPWDAEAKWLPFLTVVTVLVFWRAGLYASRERRAGAGQGRLVAPARHGDHAAFAVGTGLSAHDVRPLRDRLHAERAPDHAYAWELRARDA